MSQHSGTPPLPQLPQELQHALQSSPEARELFDALSPFDQREYARWVAEGRRLDSRERRAAQAVMRLLAS